jgi:transcriptional regulator with GAF, ATPase, and Fis domain
MTLLKDSIEQFERDEIFDALEESDWVMARAARKLGITDRMIGYKIKKYGIKRGEEAQESSREINVLHTTEKQAEPVKH